MKTNVQQRRRLVNFDRNSHDRPLVIRTNGPLPPRELFAEHPDVLEQYDTFLTLNEAVATHSRNARAKRAAAEQARADHHAAVSDALKAGADPSKLKHKGEALDAEAVAHDGFSQAAAAKLERQGAVLGAAIKTVATSCFTAAEHDMSIAGDKVASALATLDAALEQQTTAWAARRWLSHAHHVGGQTTWHGGTIDPTVREALDSIGAIAADLDTLRADETELTNWRRQNTEAAAHNAAAYAK